ncbi:helix-turn-helix domain-containing protein [Herbidospora sp. RD11066]
MDESGVTYTQLARVPAYDRSWISRSLDGQRVPNWPVVEAVATYCGASVAKADRRDT